MEKYKLQMTEEKQRLLLEASKQLRDAVAGVKDEMESKVRQAQSMAMQEALKEVNMQSSSKEVGVVCYVVCWGASVSLLKTSKKLHKVN